MAVVLEVGEHEGAGEGGEGCEGMGYEGSFWGGV